MFRKNLKGEYYGIFDNYCFGILFRLHNNQFNLVSIEEIIMSPLHKSRIMFGVLMVMILTLILYCIFTDPVYAHEEHGWYHMVSSSGPLIGMRQCDMEMQSWYHDDNGDGIVDRCSLALYTHHTMHLRPAKTEMQTGINGKPMKGCSCEPLTP